MAFQLSPGVLVTEQDLTNVVPAVSTSAGAFVGNFAWGPAQEIVTIGSENELVSKFGGPNSTNAVDFYSAANFLAYTTNLKLVRAVGSAARNAVGCGQTAVLIPNQTVYEDSFSDGTETYEFAAKYPGTKGNSLIVSICDSTGFDTWDYAANFSGAPGTSAYAAAKGASKDEVHVIVVDNLGMFTGTAGTVLEKFPYLSVASDAKGNDGGTLYYKNVINTQSKYAWWGKHPTQDDTEDLSWGAAASAGVYQPIDTAGEHTCTFTGGVDAAPATGDLEDGYSLFTDKELVDISLVITGGHSDAVCQHAIDTLSLGRLDCVTFVSPPLAAVKNNSGDEADDIVTYFKEDLNRFSSYVVADSGWKRQYDRYNDVFVNVPLNADIAGLCARTDNTNDPWFSPAGLNRGAIKNVVKLLWSPNQTNRDELYKNGINPVASLAGNGIVLYGDKTLLAKPSAFDRINVRRLFIVLEKAISTAAKFQLFEFNDVFTRAQFKSIVEPFLRDVRGRRGIFDFRVVCDESNNTGEVIDRNEFVADIFIKPAKSINFIKLNFVATRTSISFEEVGA
jgi:phage tail sheath protein FI